MTHTSWLPLIPLFPVLGSSHLIVILPACFTSSFTVLVNPSHAAVTKDLTKAEGEPSLLLSVVDTAHMPHPPQQVSPPPSATALTRASHSDF